MVISADAGPNAGDYANTLAGHHSEVRLLRPVAPPEIDSLVWLRAERRFRVVWRGFPRARATLEPAENLMPSGCAPRPFAYFPSLTTWCGQVGLHSCDVARVSKSESLFQLQRMALMSDCLASVPTIILRGIMRLGTHFWARSRVRGGFQKGALLGSS